MYTLRQRYSHGATRVVKTYGPKERYTKGRKLIKSWLRGAA